MSRPFPMKPLLCVVIVGLLGHAVAKAQTLAANTTPLSTPTTSLTTPSPSDAKALEEGRSVARIADLWNTPLDWKENNSSMAQIVAHIKKALGNKAPTIEVRGTDTNRSTFNLTQAPLGPTLSSIADLANLQVWVFPGRLLLSPKDALTPSERASVAQKVCGEWKFSSNPNAPRSGWNQHDMFNKAAFNIIGTDMKKRLAAKGASVPAPPPWERHVEGKPDVPAYELPLGELSDSSRQLLQELLNVRPSYADALWTPAVPDTTDLVTFDDTSTWSSDLRIRKPQEGSNEIGSWSVRPPQ